MAGSFPSRRLCSMGTRPTQQAEDGMWPLQPLVLRLSLPSHSWAYRPYILRLESQHGQALECPSGHCQVVEGVAPRCASVVCGLF